MPMVIMPAPEPPKNAGLTEALSLFRALVEKPGETRQFLHDYTAQLDRYDDQLKAYGTIKQIEKLREDAERHLEEARNVQAKADVALQAAKAEAEAVRKEADAFRATVEDKARQVRAKLKEREDSVTDREKRLQDERAAFEGDMENRVNALARQEQAAKEKLANAEVREAAVNDQLEKLKALGLKPW